MPAVRRFLLKNDTLPKIIQKGLELQGENEEVDKSVFLKSGNCWGNTTLRVLCCRKTD